MEKCVEAIDGMNAFQGKEKTKKQAERGFGRALGMIKRCLVLLLYVPFGVLFYKLKSSCCICVSSHIYLYQFHAITVFQTHAKWSENLLAEG